MDWELEQVLSNVGLSKNEIKVYVALLKTGESKVSAIIRNLNFRSGKIYEVLNSLLKKGLIAETLKNDIKHYTAMPPKRIEEYLKTKKIELEIQEQQLEAIMPRLACASKLEKNKTLIRVFEGIEGIKTATQYLFEKTPGKTVIYAYGASGARREPINLMWLQINKTIQQRKLTCELLVTDMTKESVKAIKKQWSKPNFRIRFSSGEHLANFTGNNEMVIIYNFEKENCILIEDRYYAASFKDVFYKLWMQARISPSS